tara:strand:- start:3294 stop:3401 length:108 start_codon:yes stop_codon:yes gene_type:complete
MPAFFYEQDLGYLAVAGMQWRDPVQLLQNDVIEVM